MKPRTRQAEKMAKLYDAEILPIWSQKFGRMMLRDLVLPPRPMVLDVGCGTGYPALEILRKMDEQGRIIAIDASSPMLDEARLKAGPLSGKRIFFRSENALPRLSFADDVYDLVVCNAGLQEYDDPEAVVRDFARVTKPGGQVIVTLPLAGTWQEFFDIFREVLIKHDRTDAVDQLDAYLVRYPPLEQAEAWLEDAGLDDVTSAFEEFTLLFKSGREFFFAPVIEFGPLAEWKALAGKGEAMQKIFWDCKEAIDAYFKDRPFGVTVIAACVQGKKRQPEAARLLLDKEEDEESATGEVELITGEIEIIETGKKELEQPVDDEDDDSVL